MCYLMDYEIDDWLLYLEDVLGENSIFYEYCEKLYEKYSDAKSFNYFELLDLAENNEDMDICEEDILEIIEILIEEDLLDRTADKNVKMYFIKHLPE